MQLLEHLALEGDEYVNEIVAFPNAKARLIWVSDKCKDGKNSVKLANELYKQGDVKEAKKKYIYAKNIFIGLKKELTKLNDGGGIAASVSKGAVALIGVNVPGIDIMVMLFNIWKLCSIFATKLEAGQMLKLRENDIEINKFKKDYDIDEPTRVKYFSNVISDLIYYCDEMAKKC